MENIIRLDHVDQYNKYMGIETHHPLVSVVDMSRSCKREHARYMYGFYTVFLKDVNCGDLRYGKNYYDYQEGTLVFIAPGQVIGIEPNGETYQPQGWALVFHPDLIRGTSLGRNIHQYGFFSYDVHEALHISEQERGVVVDLLQKIAYELTQRIDRHSRTLIVSSIELLLNYCVRFYDRQFLTRTHVNKDVLVRFESVVNEYLHSDKPQLFGLPSVRFCADKLNLSANYLGDLIKRETGKTAQEHIQLKLIELAKEKVVENEKSVSEIAYELGFRYPQHFSRLFRKVTGTTPKEYRGGV